MVRRDRWRRLRREAYIIVGLAALALALAAACLCLGAYRLSVPAVLRALAGAGPARDVFIVQDLRAPRLVVGVLAGVAFAVSGGIFQALLRNPLASPDIIGVTGGASVAAVYALTVLGAGSAAVSGWAFGGAAAVGTAVYLLAWRGGVTGHRFVLIGVAAAFMAQSALGYLLTRGELRAAQSALAWMVGSLGNARWPAIGLLAALLAGLLPAVAALRPALAVLRFGDETATGLGVAAHRARLALLALAVALAAAATAVTGPIAFVAFVASPIARRLAGTGSLALTASALVGVVVTLSADLIGQHLLPGEVQVPAGIVTGLIGGPYLLWLLGTGARTGRG